MAALLLAVLALVSAPVERLPGASVGKVEGTGAYIGLSLDGGRVRILVTDGTVSQWFRGRWDGRSRLTLRAGGHVLRIESARNAIRGRYDSHRFTARTAGGLAGMFERTERPLKGGWVALSANRVRGTHPNCRLTELSTEAGSFVILRCGSSAE